jgi:DNA-binding XRE family transcriptional regulator
MPSENKARVKPHNGNGRPSAQRVTVKGQRMVMLPQNEYDRLLRKADEWEPLVPQPDADGNYPAVQRLCATLALKIIRHRRRVGQSQAELARRAGICPETLCRVELGDRPPSVRTVEEIDKALREAEIE